MFGVLWLATALAAPWSAEEQARLEARLEAGQSAFEDGDLTAGREVAEELSEVLDESLPTELDHYLLWVNWLDVRASLASIDGQPWEQARLAQLSLDGLDGVADQLEPAGVLAIEIVLLNQLGDAYASLGRHAEALQTQQSVFVGMQAFYGEDHPQTAVAQVNLGVAYWVAGDPESALVRFDAAEAKLSRESDNPAFADAIPGLMLNRGRVLRDLHRADEAVEQLSLAVRGLSALYEDLRHPTLLLAQRDLASALRFQGHCDQALALLDPISVIADLELDHPELSARVQGERAMCLLDLERLPEAVEAQERALALTPMDSSMRGNRLLQLASLRDKLGDAKGASAAAQEALSLETLALENLISQAPDSVRLARVDQDWFTLAHLLSLLDEPRDAASVYGMVLRWKSAALQSVRTQRSAVLGSADPEVVRQREALDEVRRALLAHSMASPLVPAPLLMRRDGLEMALAARVDAARALPSPRQLCEALPEDGALVDYVFWDEDGTERGAVTAFVLRGGECGTVHRVDTGDPHEVLERALALQRRRESTDLTSERVDRDSAALRELVWDPLLPLLDDRAEVWVVPHHQLTTVSFDALSDGRGGYLVEHHALHLLDSAEDLLRVPAPTGSGALVLGASSAVTLPEGCEPTSLPPLPGVDLEVKQVQRTLRRARYRPLEVVLGDGATVDSLASLAAGRGLLHIAAHGVSVSQACRPDALPLARWGLVLDDGEGGGAWLSAEELALWDLRGVELATLSACGSARGEVGMGGVLGLRWALSVAGVEQVLSTLWPVADDTTQQLMTRFYRRWLDEGMAPDEALRATQLETLREQRERYGDGRPDVWGAFVLTGVRPATSR